MNSLVIEAASKELRRMEKHLTQLEKRELREHSYNRAQRIPVLVEMIGDLADAIAEAEEVA